MTDTELNKAVAEKLGIEWHEVVWKDCVSFKVKYCSCGYKYGFKDEEHSNPDFAANAKDLIEVLMKRDDWIFFREEIGTWNCYGGKNVWVSRISLDYILNPRLLCEEYLKWEG
jgi:hypothetical protein